jgi:threonine dehydrogenase-like Zn-dependent dehydrogenase
MKAIRFDGALRLVSDVEVPRIPGEALIQVICAGICNTDLEIAKGYAGYTGTLGHEFVGRVIESPDVEWIGRRVVGEINAGCGKCDLCLKGDSRHCPDRTVLGIKGRDGAFAEFLSLPVANLYEVPETVTDEEAVFIEPLAAAAHVLEQVNITKDSRVAILGDGKLAQLLAQVIATTRCDLTVIGKHEDKLAVASLSGARSVLLPDSGLPPAVIASQLLSNSVKDRFDIIIEATGSANGLPIALGLVKPLGSIVLKSTHHGETTADLSRLVVNEVMLIGSRCGRFAKALDLIGKHPVNVLPLVSHRLPIDEAFFAFEEAERGRALKVILNISQ